MAKLFSIKERYSKRIFNKKKRVEFRRQNVNIDNGETCLVYTSSPVKKITGYFIVKDKIRLPIERLWKKTKDLAGLTKNEFLRYFEGCKEGTAIVFRKVKKFAKGIELNKIRKKIKDFRPPQSYYGVDEDLIAVLNRLLSNYGLDYSAISSR